MAIRTVLRTTTCGRVAFVLSALLALSACGGGSSSSDSSSSTSSSSSSSSSSGSSSSSSSSSSCSSSDAQAVYITCLATAFLATVTSSDYVYSMTSDNATKYWSNLPTTFVTRHGKSLASMSTTAKAAAETLINAALSSQGQTTMAQLRLADEYLAENGGGTTDYGEDLYYVSFLGTPSTSSAWILVLTGHHYTYFYSIDASNTPLSLTPNFVGVEPVSFTSSSTTYTPMATRRDALEALLSGLDSTQLATAKLSSAMSDLVVGPQNDGNFPSTASGLAGSSLTDSQKTLLAAAIATYASDANGTGQYDAYTTDTALSSTYISWASYSDLSTKGSYVRIDGPRVWIEFSVQSGVVFSANHYHSVWRDKTYDYGGNFTF